MKIIPQINYKSVLANIKNIGKRNKVFNSLDKQSQRLEIAWEALQLSLMPIVLPSNGCYWSDPLIAIHGDSKTLQKILVTKLPPCQVCERGLIMLAQIRLGNDIDSDDNSRDDGSSKNLKGFPLASMMEMESEYESSFYDHPYYRHSKEKMANICCNILVNGNFKTKDKTDYLKVT